MSCETVFLEPLALKLRSGMNSTTLESNSSAFDGRARIGHHDAQAGCVDIAVVWPAWGNISLIVAWSF